MRKIVLGLLASALLTALPASAANGLDAAGSILEQVTGAPVRSFSTTDFGRERNVQARSVLVSQEKAEQLLTQVRRRLPPGTLAFIGVTNSLARPKPAGVELVVFQGRDQFDILRTAQTDGMNYDLDTKAIIAELQAWDKEWGVDIWQAETDTVRLRLKTMPKNMHAFAERVYKFCPDIVDQGAGSVEALAKEIERTQSVDLWWD